jgi:hypothetical protein
MALIFSELTSMPFRETRHPSTFPLVTLNTHFSGFSFNRASCIFVNVSVRFEMYVVFFLLATTMSSTHEHTFLPTCSFNAAFVILQNVGSTLRCVRSVPCTWRRSGGHTLVLRLNQETCAPRLHVHGTDRTQRHPTSRSSSHRVPNLCLTIPGPLHQVSYSCLDPRRCPPCRTCYLHTTRQANTILHTNKGNT